jgi:threonine dehydrogenase-like Zn-dependent dehydrogenase
MKLIRIHGPSDVRLDEVDEPQMGERDVILGIAACGVCGTDLSYIRHGGLIGPGDEPMAIGHEAAGIVEAVGSEVSDIAVGDRVVLHPGNDRLGRVGNGTVEGALAPRLLVRDAAGGGRLFRVPDGLDLTVAALAEPLAVGMNAVDRCGVGPGSKVVVFGCGPIGLSAIATLADRGIDDVVAIDVSARRRELAVELGARAALDPTESDVWAAIDEMHGTADSMFGPTTGTDAYIEASGAAAVITAVIQHAKPGSCMSVVAVHGEDIPVSFLQILVKQLTITGAMEYPDRFESALELLERRDLSPMITHRFDLDDFGEALELLQGSPECGKVMITVGAPGGGDQPR